MTTASPRKKNNLYYIHSVIGLIIMFGFGYLPAVEPITPIGMELLGIFIALVYFWSTVGNLWPSLLGLIALGLSDYTDMKGAMAAFGNDTVVQIIFIMALVGVMESAGLSQAIAQWFVSRRINRGRPWVFSLMLLLATYVLAALTNAVAAILLCWTILYGILEQLGYKPGDRYSSLMVTGVVYASCLGLAALPFKSVPLIILGAFEKASGLAVDYLAYMATVICLSLIAIIGYILLLRFVYRPDITLLKNADNAIFGKGITLNRRQQLILIVLGLFLLAMLLPSILPKSFFLCRFLNALGVTGITVATIIFMAWYKLEDKPLLNFKEVAGNGIAWDLVFLAAAALAVSTALTADETGIKAFLIDILMPIFAGKSVLIFSITLILLSIILTNFATNVVIGLIFMPIVYSMSSNIGANAPALATLLTLCLHVALLTPAASPSGALLHGNKTWLTAKEALLSSTVLILLSTIIIIVIGIPLTYLFF